MTELGILVGIPGSGKSSYLSHLRETEQIITVCPDEIRLALTGDMSDQTRNGEVWQIAWKMIDDYLIDADHHRLRIFLDATSLTPRDRKKAIELGRNHNATVFAYLFKTPHEISKTRNLRRTRVVPEDVMDRMIAKFDQHCSVEALQAEGFRVVVPAIVR